MEIQENGSVDRNAKQEVSLNCLRDELQRIGSTWPPSAPGFCIYRVPLDVRKINEAAYTPTMVSIGPFHHGNQRLQSMHELKLRYLNEFLERTRELNSLDDYFDAVRGWEGRIRACYSESIPMKSGEFVSMIVTDACFIIELFVASSLALERGTNEDQPLLAKRWPRDDITTDLILLENQIPFFVLEGLFNLAFPHGLNDRISFHELTHINFCLSFLSSIYPEKNDMFHKLSLYRYFEGHHLKLSNGNRLQVEHLCDMLRAFYVPSINPPTRSTDTNVMLKCPYTANQLHEAGLKFDADKSKGIFELQYSHGVVKMPIIGNNGLTEIMLRNLAAFEQCHHPLKRNYIPDHIQLLDDLISTGKDVEILVEKGIIENFSGDNETAATIVNELGRNIYQHGMNANYSDAYLKLHEFYNNPYRRYKAIFVRDYWNTPWKRASLFGGLLLLLLTLIQTVCSIISLFKENVA